jgi:hypothetical protein
MKVLTVQAIGHHSMKVMRLILYIWRETTLQIKAIKRNNKLALWHWRTTLSLEVWEAWVFYTKGKKKSHEAMKAAVAFNKRHLLQQGVLQVLRFGNIMLKAKEDVLRERYGRPGARKISAALKYGKMWRHKVSIRKQTQRESAPSGVHYSGHFPPTSAQVRCDFDLSFIKSLSQVRKELELERKKGGEGSGNQRAPPLTSVEKLAQNLLAVELENGGTYKGLTSPSIHNGIDVISAPPSRPLPRRPVDIIIDEIDSVANLGQSGDILGDADRLAAIQYASERTYDTSPFVPYVKPLSPTTAFSLLQMDVNPVGYQRRIPKAASVTVDDCVTEGRGASTNGDSNKEALASIENKIDPSTVTVSDKHSAEEVLKAPPVSDLHQDNGPTSSVGLVHSLATLSSTLSPVLKCRINDGDELPVPAITELPSTAARVEEGTGLVVKGADEDAPRYSSDNHTSAGTTHPESNNNMLSVNINLSHVSLNNSLNVVDSTEEIRAMKGILKEWAKRKNEAVTEEKELASIIKVLLLPRDHTFLPNLSPPPASCISKSKFTSLIPSVQTRFSRLMMKMQQSLIPIYCLRRNTWRVA